MFLTVPSRCTHLTCLLSIMHQFFNNKPQIVSEVLDKLHEYARLEAELNRKLEGNLRDREAEYNAKVATVASVTEETK